MPPLKRLKAFLGDAYPDRPSDETGRQTTTSLYECPACETVYVSEGMESCSQCGNGVDHVPNEQDIGIEG